MSEGRAEMGEKGNSLLEFGEGIFENLAEQGPQFWLNYEQFKLTRAQSSPARVVEQQAAVAERDESAPDATAQFRWRPPRATE